MKLKKIVIKNYKSIKELEFFPDAGLNAIIGENSVGKSNIFNAINWLIGPMYPSFNSVMKQDHWEGNDENKIFIELQYDNGSLLELNEHKETVNRQNQIEIKSGLFYNHQDFNCKGEIRDQYASAYLGTDREILDYLPSNRWTLIGRILQQINSNFQQETLSIQDSEGNIVNKKKTDLLKDELAKIRDELLFSTGRTGGERNGLMDQFVNILQTESAKQLNRDASSFSVDLSLYDPWNFYRTLQILVKEGDMDMQFQASSLGMGVQASITIAVLKAYAELNLPNKTPIFIDEPELYLHPQAQRNFYNLLREMTQDKFDADGVRIQEGLQIFYTTHSPNFLRTDKFNEIFIATKNREKGTTLNYAKVSDFILDLQVRKSVVTTPDVLLLHFKNAYENTGDSQKANEAFFAKKIILVEGQSESLILPYLFELAGFDYIKEGVSIVRCGSKTELDRFFRLYNEFGIPCFIIFDGDKQHHGTSDEAETILRNRAIFDLFGINQDWPDGSFSDRYLGFERDLENELGFTTSKKGLELFIETKRNISDGSQIPIWVRTLISKIVQLNTPLPSVLKNTL